MNKISLTAEKLQKKQQLYNLELCARWDKASYYRRKIVTEKADLKDAITSQAKKL